MDASASCAADRQPQPYVARPGDALGAKQAQRLPWTSETLFEKAEATTTKTPEQSRAVKAGSKAGRREWWSCSQPQWFGWVGTMVGIGDARWLAMQVARRGLGSQ